MRCSACGTDVEKYYHGRQCKPCARKPFKRWYRNNRDKANEISRKWRKDNPKTYRQCLLNWRANNRTIYLIHSRLKIRWHVRYLTDVYIKRQIRRSWGKAPHIITDQEIDERRQQIIRWREKRVKKQEPEKEPTVFCPMVKREIRVDVCQRVQKNYDNCHEDCEHKGKKIGEE